MADTQLTGRGFAIKRYQDLYGVAYSLQKSSLATEDAIWLGVTDADPQIMDGGRGWGWVKYPLHAGVSINTRMHLSRQKAAELIADLQKFVDSGDI